MRLYILAIIILMVGKLFADQGPTGLKFEVKKSSPVTYNFYFDYASGSYTSPTRLFLGYVPKNSILYLYPYLKNCSKDSMIVDGIRPSCSCTKVGFNHAKIAPKDSIKLDVRFNTTGFANNKWIRKSVWVFSDQIPKKGRIRFFYESIISFDSAKVVPKDKVIKLNKNIVNLTVTNKSKKSYNKLGYYTTTPEYFEVDMPKSFVFGKNQIGIKAKKSVKKLFKSSITFYSRSDSTCNFSLPVFIYPH